MDDLALEALLSACPGLETFEFAAATRRLNQRPLELFNPTEAKDLIMWHAPSLKKVVLHMGHSPVCRYLKWYNKYERKTVEKAFEEMGIEFKLLDHKSHICTHRGDWYS